jgi:hypothetical protein
MEIKTEVNPIYIIRMSKAEAEQALNDSSELEALLRSTLGYREKAVATLKPATKRGTYKKRAAKEHTPNWATNGNAGNKARGAAVKSTGTAKCEGCGKKFKVQGLGPHKRRCPEYQLKTAGNKAKQQVMSGVE